MLVESYSFETLPLFGRALQPGPLARDATHLFTAGSWGTVLDIAAARSFHSANATARAAFEGPAIFTRGATGSTIQLDWIAATDLANSPACAIVYVVSLTGVASGSYIAPMRAASTSLATLTAPSNNSLSAIIRNSSGADAVGPVSVMSGAPWTGAVGYRVLPGGNGSQIWVNGSLASTAGSSFTPAAGQFSLFSVGDPTFGLGAYAVAVWPRSDIGESRMQQLTRNPKLLFSAEPLFIPRSFVSFGAPTLSDLRAINVTSNSAQWSIDYVF